MSILNEIRTWGTLSQVWFVHDYVQLQFHDGQQLSVFNPFEVSVSNNIYQQGQPGYADTLVAIIGNEVRSVNYAKSSHLQLEFGNGSIFKINLASGITSLPEAFECGLSSGLYIEFNTQ